MNADGKLVTEDLQASQPDVRLGLSRAGVQGVAKAIHLRWGRFEQVVSAEIDCTVDLVASQKGVHMSRFPELFEEAIERVVIGEALVIEALAEHIAQHIVERQRALRAEVRIRAQYPLERRTPVTKLATQEMVALIGIAAATSEGDVRRLVGVEATGINACPCAQGLVRDRASERLLDAGFDENDVDRILELVPLATHNQRGRGTLYVGTERQLNAERLVEIVESSMSSPVYELLKRPDELFVVEHAHLQPRFVEDSVRVALATTLERFPDLADADFLYSRQVNLETIHSHDVLAERYGTVGELRSRARGGDRAGAAHEPRGLAARMTETLTRPPDTDSLAGKPWDVIVLNDNHNTFQGVAFALSSTLPGVDYEKGMRIADRIHSTGRAVVWSGHREPAELYWEKLTAFGLTMAPLEPAV